MSKEKEILKSGDEKLEAVEEALSKTERFIENNQKMISIVVGVLVVVVLAYFGLNRYYFEPREKEAQVQMFAAEKYFELDSLNKALYGNDNDLGFIDIIDQYGSTKAGNLAKYYTGISFLRQGNFQEAINYLKKFSSDDHIIAPIALGATADAYFELNDPTKAADLYVKAANKSDNEFTKPMFLFKAGRTFESMSNLKKATEMYQMIKKDFPNSNEGRTIDKYLERAKGRA